MIVKNLRHHLRLATSLWKLIWRYDVLIEKGVTAKYVDKMRFGQRCTVQSGAYLYGSRRGEPVVFGDHVVVSAHVMLLGEGGVEIGASSHVGPNVVITSQFGDSTSDMLAPDARLKYLPVRIGRGCWIGAGAVIMPGVVLGDRCVVAPNSVVFGAWPDDVKLSGAPARRSGR